MPSIACDECGSVREERQGYPFQKFVLYPEVVLCPKCLKRAKQGEDLEVYKHVKERLQRAKASRASIPKRKRKKGKARSKAAVRGRSQVRVARVLRLSPRRSRKI